MLTKITITIEGQADPEAEDFKLQWRQFTEEMYRHLATEFLELKPFGDRMVHEVSVKTEEIQPVSSVIDIQPNPDALKDLYNCCRTAVGVYRTLKITGLAEHLDGYSHCLKDLTEAINKAERPLVLPKSK